MYKQWLALVGYFSGKRSWCPSGQFSENISGQRSKHSDRHDCERNREKTSYLCEVCDFNVMFWSPHFKTDILDLETTEKVARFGTVRKEQATGNWEPVM